MKKLFLLFAAAVLSTARAQDVKLAGKIENPNSDSVKILNSSRETLYAFPVAKDGSFSGTLSVKEGRYTLYDGAEQTPLFLKPSFDLFLTLNTKEFDESIVYKGTGANENNYLAQKVLWEETNQELDNPGIFARLDEKPFLKVTDSTAALKNAFLEKYAHGLASDFAGEEKRFIAYEKLNRIANYEWMHQHFTKDSSFSVSADFPNAFENLNLADEQFAEDDTYISLVQAYLKEKAQKDASRLYIAAFTDAVHAEIQNAKVKNGLAGFIIQTQLLGNEHLDTTYTLTKPLISDEKLLAKLEERYAVLQVTQKGKPSPAFALNNSNEKNVSLADLKGKVVYIDVWATWCGPCKREIPELQKVEKEFHGKDIAFVSICTFDEKEKWENFLKEKSLGGIQLYAPKDDAFIKTYDIRSIPRFILLDKEGKIVDADAKRPSQDGLREQLNSLL